MISYFLYRLISVYQMLIIVWCIMSWIPRGGETLESIRGALRQLVDPYLSLFRRYIPPFSGIDFSPIIAIVVLRLVQSVILYIL